MSEVQQQYRKAGDMVDACAGLLRLLEVVVLSMPDAFLQPPLHNFNKLMEVRGLPDSSCKNALKIVVWVRCINT